MPKMLSLPQTVFFLFRRNNSIANAQSKEKKHRFDSFKMRRTTETTINFQFVG